ERQEDRLKYGCPPCRNRIMSELAWRKQIGDENLIQPLIDVLRQDVKHRYESVPRLIKIAGWSHAKPQSHLRTEYRPRCGNADHRQSSQIKACYQFGFWLAQCYYCYDRQHI